MNYLFGGKSLSEAIIQGNKIFEKKKEKSHSLELISSKQYTMIFVY